MDRARLLARARDRGVNPVVYWVARAVLQPFFHLYFRVSRLGREHVPQSGPLIIASNHRSFLDPFIIATLVRRPVYFVAKRELFEKRWQGWLLNSLGAFPIDRGNADADAMSTARVILERGDVVVIFPEGTRVRPGPLGEPKRGVGRLAVETGAPVVPVALIGTEAIRRGWRIRPHKVRIRCGRPLTFPHVESPSPSIARAVIERIWPCVALQWEWLGGTAPVRRAAVIGAGAWGTSVAVALARAGVEVDLGCRTAQQAAVVAASGRNDRYLEGIVLPDPVTVRCVDELELERHDLVCFAVPARALPVAVAAHGARIPRRAGVVVLAQGLVPPQGTLPSAYVAERTTARAVAALAGPGDATEALVNGASLVVACPDVGFGRQVAELLRSAGLDAQRSTDTVGAELAACAKDAAALAASTAAAYGAAAAGAAAGKVFGEVAELARRRGADEMTFAGLAGTGDLVATLVADGAGSRRAGELLGPGGVRMLASALRAGRVDAPATTGLAELVEGRLTPERWAEALSEPRRIA